MNRRVVILTVQIMRRGIREGCERYRRHYLISIFAQSLEWRSEGVKIKDQRISVVLAENITDLQKLPDVVMLESKRKGIM